MARVSRHIWKTEDMAGFVPLALCDDELAAAVRSLTCRVCRVNVHTCETPQVRRGQEVNLKAFKSQVKSSHTD